MTTPHGKQRLLVLRAQDGDAAAFSDLVDRHQQRLFRICYMILHDRMEAEDVVQESLLTAWQRIELLNEPDAFGGWLAQIASRTATDAARKHARRATDTAEDQEFDRAPHSNSLGGATGAGLWAPERSAMANAQIEALADVLQQLEPQQRACWLLREIEGMSYAEVASIVRATEDAVRGRIARARARILKEMTEWR